MPPNSSSPSGKLVLLIGPSGVGKSVILKKIREKHPSTGSGQVPEFRFPRSATTRPRRQGEGDDLYRFVSDAEFDQLLNQKKILEWAVVHGGARYATLIDEIIPFIEQGQTVIREVDVQGFESIRTHELFSGSSPRYELRSIFILPENKEQLIARIQKRAPISDDELKRRIQSMEKEMEYAKLCTVQIVNKNGKLNDTLADVEAAIMR